MVLWFHDSTQDSARQVPGLCGHPLQDPDLLKESVWPLTGRRPAMTTELWAGKDMFVFQMILWEWLVVFVFVGFFFFFPISMGVLQISKWFSRLVFWNRNWSQIWKGNKEFGQPQYFIFGFDFWAFCLLFKKPQNELMCIIEVFLMHRKEEMSSIFSTKGLNLQQRSIVKKERGRNLLTAESNDWWLKGVLEMCSLCICSIVSQSKESNWKASN